MGDTDDPILERLLRLSDEIESRKVTVRAFENGKETVLAFESFNLGLSTAHDLLGCAIGQLSGCGNRPISEVRE